MQKNQMYMNLNKIELVEIWFGNNYIPEIKGKSFLEWALISM